MPGRVSNVNRSAAKGKGKTETRSKKAVSQQSKAGITFPVGRLSRYMKQGRYAERIGGSAAVFMAGTLEYLVCELLELAGNAAEEHKKKTIAPRHLQLAIRQDEELAKMMAATMIYEGGVMSNINQFLLPAKKGKKAEATQEM